MRHGVFASANLSDGGRFAVQRRQNAGHGQLGRLCFQEERGLHLQIRYLRIFRATRDLQYGAPGAVLQQKVSVTLTDQ